MVSKEFLYILSFSKFWIGNLKCQISVPGRKCPTFKTHGLAWLILTLKTAYSDLTFD